MSFFLSYVDNQTFKLDIEGVIWISDCCPLVVIKSSSVVVLPGLSPFH